ncbi:hypothetical protein BaRGS_00036079, partial [Batillaria attramentaria]
LAQTLSGEVDKNCTPRQPLSGTALKYGRDLDKRRANVRNQSLLMSTISPQTSCDTELQGSNTVLVHQSSFDGGGSVADMVDGPGPGHHPMVLEGEEEERGPLRSKAEFLLLLTSLSLGTRNMLQYPALAMKHGGGLAYSMLVVSSILLIYGNTYTAWSIYYWVSSLAASLPWQPNSTDWTQINDTVHQLSSLLPIDTHTINSTATRISLHLQAANITANTTINNRSIFLVFDGLGEIGGIQVYLFLCLTFAWVTTGLAVAWGPQSMSRGVSQGCGRFSPHVGKNWLEYRNSVIITVINLAVTLLGTCILFAALGSQLLLDVKDVKQLHMSGIDLAFGLLPSMASQLPVPPAWLVLWFAALTLGGIGVQAGLLHVIHDTVVTLACAEQRRWQVFLLVMLVLLLLLLGLSTVTQGGLYVVQFLEHYIYLLAVPAVCLGEVLTLMWLYGVQRFANRITDMTGNSESFLWKWMWKFLCPTVLARLKSLATTPRDWGPRHLEHEPQFELPDYVICSPDVYRPANALALLTANLYLPNLSNFLSVEQSKEENSEMSGGYLSDLMTITSSDDEEAGDNSQCGGRESVGAFFIAYLVMMVFCGLPLVFMELAFGQYASLGPITVWKAAPLFKGVGYSMVLISALVSVYYNMVTAWAFHFLFTSLTARLPWGFCNNTWNTLILSNCSGYDSDLVGHCVGTLRDVAGDDAVESYQEIGTNYTSPRLGRLGSLKWQMVLCLLLCWVIIFFCLLRGIKTAGKVSYVVVLVPYVAVLILLIRGVSMTGSSDGIHFYTTPNWELLRDALLVCVGDTLMSVLAGFAVFAMMGVLSDRLGASVEDVIQSDVGMTFIVYPAALLSFPLPSLWSVLFFLTLVTMGLGTTFCTIETIITAIIDEQPMLFKKKRVVMLSVVCTVSFLIGLPLTAQGGLYLLQLMDEYLCSFPLMVAGITMCLGIAWVYGLQQFCRDIEHMIKTKVGFWWRLMWSSVSPCVILFIMISSAIGYQSLGKQFNFHKYPWWSEARIQTLCRPTRDWGPALEKNSYLVEYFPAVQTNLLAVELDHPPLNTITGDKADVNYELWDKDDNSVMCAALNPQTGADRVEFTTVGVRVPSESQPSLLPISQQLPNGARMKTTKPLDMRQKAILNHAYSNPQCHLSNGSIEKLTQTTRIASSSDGALDNVIVTPRVRNRSAMKDASTQTVVSCFEKIKRQVSEPIGRATTPPTPAETLPRSMSWMQEGEPAVIEVEVTRF